MKEIYKAEDIVYHWEYGQGVIKNINSKKDYPNDTHPINCIFNGNSYCFTNEGIMLGDKIPTLSFTPYDFVKGGFSQVRPLKVGQIVYCYRTIYFPKIREFKILIVGEITKVNKENIVVSPLFDNKPSKSYVSSIEEVCDKWYLSLEEAIEGSESYFLEQVRKNAYDVE